MAAVAQRTQANGLNHHDDEHETNERGLDDLDAALLQSLIAKRVVKLDDAVKTLDALTQVTGTFPLCI